MRLKTKQNIQFEKQIPRILLAGILWGLIELYAGSWLKTVQPALFGFNMPLITGAFILIAKYFIPVRGSAILMGVISALIIFLFRGMILHGAFMAILLEAVLVEIIFFPFGANIWSFLISGVAIQIYSAYHPLLSRGIFCQSSHYVSFKRWFIENIYTVASDALSKEIMTFIFLFVHILFGLVAGGLALSMILFLRKNFVQNQK